MLLHQTIRAAQPIDRPRLVDTIARAFESDPAARWMYPHAADYWQSFPTLIEALGGRAVDHGTAFCADEFAGAALWLPPDVNPDEAALVALIETSVDARLKDAAFTMFEQMAHYHPREAHWYLPFIGVPPEHQGNGVGAALLERALAGCDRDRLPAYLEATSPKSVPLYRRHGFEVVAVIEAGSSAPPIYPMVRARR